MKNKRMLKRILAGVVACTMLCGMLTSCTEASRVSYNVSKEAENFNIIRRLVVINSRSDKIIYELEGAFSIEVDHEDNQLEVTCETEKEEYKKHFINLNEWTTYFVEDLSGASVDKYHYEVRYLPEGNVVPFEVKESN